MGGKDSWINKTLSFRERNEESCGDESGIIRVPVIVEPVVVPVPGATTPAEATDIQIAIRVMVAYNKSSQTLLFEYSRSCI